VLLAWENEAFLSIKEFGADKFDIVVPSVSIKAEPPVAVVESNAKRRGTEAVAKAYLDFLYTEEAQKVIAKNFYRPSLESVATASSDKFPRIELFTIEAVFGGWAKAQATHFADGGIFDSISARK